MIFLTFLLVAFKAGKLVPILGTDVASRRTEILKKGRKKLIGTFVEAENLKLSYTREHES